MPNPSRLLGRLRSTFQSGFVRSVATLAGGTAASQAIWLLTTPFLTRLYSSEDFSVFGAFVALMSMLSIAACAGYDNAVVVPDKDEDAASVLALSLFLAFALSSLVALVWLIFTMATSLLAQQWLGDLQPYAWALAPVVFVAATFNAVQFWTSRRRRFSSVARVRVAQATVGVGTQIGAGMVAATPLGLIIGQGLNFLLGVLVLGHTMVRELGTYRAAFRMQALRASAYRFRNFALMTTPALFANSASVQVPVLIVARAGQVAEAGFLFLALRVMQAPLTTIGAAVSQVFYTEAPQAGRDGRLAGLTHDVLRQLAIVGLGPLIFAGIVGRPVFEIVFGQGWGRAGEIVAWMVPWLMLQFLASPISMLLYALERQRVDLLLQLLGMLLRIGPVLAAALLAPNWLPEVFALTGAAFYAVYLEVLRRVAGLPLRSLMHAIGEARWIVLAWIALGMLLRAGIHAIGWA